MCYFVLSQARSRTAVGLTPRGRHCRILRCGDPVAGRSLRGRRLARRRGWVKLSSGTCKLAMPEVAGRKDVGDGFQIFFRDAQDDLTSMWIASIVEPDLSLKQFWIVVRRLPDRHADHGTNLFGSRRGDFGMIKALAPKAASKPFFRASVTTDGEFEI